MISDLIYKELIEEITPEESRILKKWLEEPANRALYDRIRQKQGLGKRLCEYVDIDSQKDFRSTLPAPALAVPRRNRGLRYALYAAALVPLLVVAAFFGLRDDPAGRTVRHPEVVHNSEGAQLILSSGQVVDLAADEGRPVVLAEANAVVDARDGERTLSYKKSEAAAPAAEIPAAVAAPAVHTLVVPRGVNYNVELSDGTVVYLDADSRLEYPVYFAGERREVTVSGRAYFDVAHDAEHPFIVRTNRAEIQVFGTEFCVSASGSQSVTTLVKGSVGLFDAGSGEQLALLTPGQQAVVSGDRCEVRQVETLYQTAWKDGYFIFESKPVGSIMEELSAWYNIDYVLKDSLQNVNITARIKRYDDIESVLNILSKTRSVNFKRDGRVVTVMN